jgi:hypothetical protein
MIPKFRAWHIELEEMIDVRTINFYTRDILAKDCRLMPFKDIHLMQYTGLESSNGIKIYESDCIDNCGKNKGYLKKYLMKNLSCQAIRALDLWVVGSMTSVNWHNNYLELIKRGCKNADIK